MADDRLKLKQLDGINPNKLVTTDVDGNVVAVLEIGGGSGGQDLLRVLRVGEVIDIETEKQYLIHSEFTNFGTINIGGPAGDLPGYDTQGELVVLHDFMTNEGIINNDGLIIFDPIKSFLQDNKIPVFAADPPGTVDGMFWAVDDGFTVELRLKSDGVIRAVQVV